jgi:predicted phosphate transport protein (TIGR00153 family)
MKLFKKDRDFFEMFDKAGKNLVNASTTLVELFESFDTMPAKVKAISELEHENDMLTHEIFRMLNQTFITPIDREDIHLLASRMDDILDLMWAAAERSQLFKIGQTTPEAAALAKTLKQSVELLYKTLTHLRMKQYSFIQDLCIQIHGFENQNDTVFREALGKMFEEEKDPVKIIKWKEIYEDLETATDRCEDVANILESIVLKYG